MFPTDNDFEANFTLETENSILADDDLPFNLLFLGNWSGSRNSLDKDTAKFNPIEIDRDNFDEVMKKYQCSLDLRFQNEDVPSLNLKFSELDDFHPDRIFQQVPIFANLYDIRRKLTNSNTYNVAAREIRSWMPASESKESVESQLANPVSVSDQPENNLLDQILGQKNSDPSLSQNANAVSKDLNSFIAKLVKPYIIQTDLEEQSNLLMIVDELISNIMRKILHHPQFQELEAAWRGIYLLVRKVETDHNLKIFLFDVDKYELSESLKSNTDLTENPFYQLISDSDKSWAFISGNYTFSLNVDDVALLVRLAKIGCSNNISFISHIQPQMFAFYSFNPNDYSQKLTLSVDSTESKLWNILRSLPESSHLGLALPRFLARLPYGIKTEPTEVFYFEEFTDSVEHEQFLWVNPTFICSLLLAQSFSEFGWEMKNHLVQNFDGLPLYYQENTSTKTQSPTEISMTQNNAEIILNQGLMPLIFFRDTDRIRVGRFQSIDFSESMLGGKWK